MKQKKPSQTAARVALTRAIEYLSPENRRICSDPYAHRFLDDEGARIYDSWMRRKLFFLRSEMGFPGVIGAVMARTQFVDDCLADAIASGIQQVVILGAGYDTRGMRIETPAGRGRVFEVDHPATQKRKCSILAKEFGPERARLTFVPVRFNSETLEERLVRSGYKPAMKTLFIWEGVTYYLAPEAVDSTLAFVSRHSSPKSAIVFDYFPPSVADGSCRLKEAAAMRSLFATFGEGFAFGVEPARMEAFLSARGFVCVRNVGNDFLYRKYIAAKGRKLKVSEIFSVVHATVRVTVDG